jgi:hypothetical protein
VMTFGPACFFQDGGTVGSFKWSGYIVDGGCAPTAVATPSVTITSTRTLCCAP